MASQTRCKIIIFFRLHQINLNLSSDIPVFFCFQPCFTMQKTPVCHCLQEAIGNRTYFQPLQQHSQRLDNPSTKLASERRPRFDCITSQIRSCHVPEAVVSHPRFGRITSQIRSRLVPDSLPNTGSLTEIIGLGSEMVIPPSLPSIIRNTDWSILRNKKRLDSP